MKKWKSLKKVKISTSTASLNVAGARRVSKKKARSQERIPFTPKKRHKSKRTASVSPISGKTSKKKEGVGKRVEQESNPGSNGEGVLLLLCNSSAGGGRKKGRKKEIGPRSLETRNHKKKKYSAWKGSILIVGQSIEC